MTESEATLILNIMATADNGCSSCVRHLFARFLNRYPEKIELADKIWQKQLNEQSEDWKKICSTIGDNDSDE